MEDLAAESGKPCPECGAPYGTRHLDGCSMLLQQDDDPDEEEEDEDEMEIDESIVEEVDPSDDDGDDIPDDFSLE